MSGKNAKSQTKEEQEELLKKLGKHSKEETKGDKKPVIDAAGVDFGISVEEQ